MAADRQSRDGQLHVQHGARVPAAGVGMAGDNRGVAGQLLVEPEAAGCHVQQRVEPLQAAQDNGHQAGAGIAAGQVGLFMGEHQGSTVGTQSDPAPSLRATPRRRRAAGGPGR